MSVTFGVLGPLVAAGTGGPIRLPGPRHRAVLARLLIARRRVVPVRVLVDDLWEDPPEGAVGAIQTFVATLRRALEPDRPARAPATLLVTSAPGYALRASAVDAWQFEAAVASSTSSSLDFALGLWRGPAYSEFADEHWARAEITRLEELRLLAVERRAEAALTLGQAAAVAADLRAHVAEHPWREHGRRLLALALYRAGRQRDALDALRTARTALVEELGVAPGPELRRLESDILAQDPRLAGPHALAGPEARDTDRPARMLSQGSPPQGDPRFSFHHTGTTISGALRLVGREQQFAALTKSAAATLAAPRPHLALISGDPGAGKTALVEAFAASLGWTTAWGRSPEGAPAAWPWTQVLDTFGVKLPEAAARFHAHRAVVSAVAATAQKGPLLLVFDDLHWAGEETLALLAALVAEPVNQPVLVVGTFRATDRSPALDDFLARAARAEPTRVDLTGLGEAAVKELVELTTHREVHNATARQIHERSGGNPFFVRELARLFDAEGDITSVPTGVRDVIRHRLAALPEPAHTVLKQAAVIGRDVDLDLLVPLAGDEGLALDALDKALLHGFLTETDDRTRFAHALVRDTLYQDVSAPRRKRWHAKIADTLERLRPDDVDALAHHHLLARSRKAAHYAGKAAERAERRFAPHEAARLWREAIDSHDGDPRTGLELVMGLVRSLAVTGDLEQARQHRAQAIATAETLDDPLLTARVIGAFDVPGIWTTNDDPKMSEHVVNATERTLAALPDDREADRARLLSTLAMELRGTGSPRGAQAAAQAEAIARQLRDPALEAFALNGRFMHTFHRTGLSRERAAIGRELVDLATEHELVTYEVLGRLILVQAHSATAEFDEADEHATRADRLAERHDLPLVGVFTEWYAALRTAATGGNAEAAYRKAARGLDGTGMWGVERGLLPLALLSLGIHEPDADWGPHEPWARPHILLDTGDRDGARAALDQVPDSPADLLKEARLCLVARAAVELGDRPVMERVHAELLPAAGELAGAGSGLVTFGPVDRYLALLRP